MLNGGADRLIVLNGKIHEIHKDEKIPYDILETLWRDQKLKAIDNPYGSWRARVNGNFPYAEAPLFNL